MFVLQNEIKYYIMLFVVVICINSSRYIGENILATFSYTAIDQKGKEIKSSIEATDIEQAKSLIKEEGNLPISVSAGSVLSRDINITIVESKPKPRDLAVFCRQFVSITSAGVPITSALEMLTEQTENKMMKAALAESLTSIQAGSSLSEALTRHPKIFSNLLVTMVRAGEESGSLDVSFGRMAEQYEKEAKLKAFVMKSSVYPLVIMVVAILVVILLLAFVVPQFETMLSSIGSELPALTVAVVAASDFIIEFWYIVGAVIIGGVVGINRFAKTEVGKVFFGKAQLRLPLFGDLAVKTAAASTCRTLSTLVAGGIPLINALEIVAGTMTNVQFKESLLEAKDSVSMGAPLSEQFIKGSLYPPLVCHMTKIGEETGDIDGMLTKVADYYDDEVEAATAMVMSAIEPATIVVLAVIIGTIVGAVMLPMMEMYDALGNM